MNTQASFALRGRNPDVLTCIATVNTCRWGSGEAKTEDDLTLELLVTFDGDIERDPNIENIEVLPQTVHVSFMDLEPDWMKDPGNFESQ